MDPEAERALFASLREVLHDRTVLLISHRFSTVRDADRIYVLADGRVVECGDHDERDQRQHDPPPAPLAALRLFPAALGPAGPIPRVGFAEEVDLVAIHCPARRHWAA